MESNENGKREYRRPWFLILIMILIMTIIFGGPAKPLIPGSISWFLTICAFFGGLTGGIWIGLRKGKRHGKEARKI